MFLDPPRRRRGRAAVVLASTVALVAAVAAAGVVVAGAWKAGDGPPSPRARPPARAFVRAWERGDYRRMYALLTRRSRRRVSYHAFRHAYRAAARTATLSRLRTAGPLRLSAGTATVPLSASTRLFGDLDYAWRFRLALAGRHYGVSWQPWMVYPGLAAGERLVRRVHVPRRRGSILARDGTVLASGPPGARVYPQGAPFAVVTGSLAPPVGAAAATRRAVGWPAGRPYGKTGLEASLDRFLGGLPRISLLADGAGGTRRLGAKHGRRPRDVRTTLSVGLQDAAAAAFGSRYGGVVALDPRTGAVLADVALGMDVTQPPGSSFKIVTASAALAAGVARPTTTYAYATSVVIDGWNLHNFHHESCGGSLVLAFATSCNSVFAPLADSVGARRLVDTATRFGFNGRPTIAYPVPRSTTPAAKQMGSALDVGVAGIGQGGVVATPLQMASVAQTIASHGLRREPYVIAGPPRARDRSRPRRAIPRTVAAELRTMMEAVVTEGTGTSAALSGITVAGKTGTAEVGPAHTPTDAWFAAFAPAEAPRLAVSVLVVRGGVGGEVAAPIARDVLAAGLGS